MATSTAEIDRFENQATAYYFLWFAIYLILGLAAIALPAMAAMGIPFGESSSKYLAGLGAAAAATYGFLKPNDYAASFDSAVAELRSLRSRFELLTEEQRADRMDHVYHLMAFKYQGDIAARNRATSSQDRG